MFIHHYCYADEMLVFSIPFCFCCCMIVTFCRRWRLQCSMFCFQFHFWFHTWTCQGNRQKNLCSFLIYKKFNHFKAIWLLIFHKKERFYSGGPVGKIYLNWDQFISIDLQVIWSKWLGNGVYFQPSHLKLRVHYRKFRQWLSRCCRFYFLV